MNSHRPGWTGPRTQPWQRDPVGQELFASTRMSFRPQWVPHRWGIRSPVFPNRPLGGKPWTGHSVLGG